MVDKFTGKSVDKVTDRLPHYNGGSCDTCGSATIDHCPVCGAPQCCPVCCASDEVRARLLRVAKAGNHTAQA